MHLVDLKEVGPETRHVLAAAHALVRLDDGTIVGDPMEKTTLEALGWQLKSSDNVRPIPPGNDPASAVAAHKASVNLRRRFQFSSALKRMSTVSTLQSSKALACVKGAPETIKVMLRTVPDWYDETYKWYTRRGSRVLALAFKEMHGMSLDKVHFSDGSLLRGSAHVHL